MKDFQSGVDAWMDACFGEPIKSDRIERADRLTEEVLELVQTVEGFTADRAHALVDYVFARSVGERGQEVGGSMVCLAALCNTFGISIIEEAERELARVWTKVEQIRAKQAAKPTGSALPVAPQPAADSVTGSIRELKPCPSCGGRARLAYPNHPSTGFIYCEAGCGVEVRTDCQADAVMTWNNRAEEKAITSARALLTKVRDQFAYYAREHRTKEAAAREDARRGFDASASINADAAAQKAATNEALAQEITAFLKSSLREREAQ